MIKQNINIVDMPILYNILEEIKDNLSFKIVNYIKLEDFKKFLNENKVLNNILVVTKFENKLELDSLLDAQGYEKLIS